MKKLIEYKHENKNGYHFITEEFEKTGIFFQPVIQPIEHTTGLYDPEGYPFSAYDFADNCKKSKLYRMIQIILGNKKQVDSIEEYINDFDFAGVVLNTIVPPIYFKRTYRKLTAIAKDPAAEIEKIISVGYESPYNNCSGSCFKERTTIKTKHGTRRLTKKESFHYTYKHVVERELVPA